MGDTNVGTTIELFLEQRIHGKWTYLEPVDLNDAYDMFSLLCGVRNFYRCTPIVTRKNQLPPDLTDVTRMCNDKVICYGEGYLEKNDLDHYHDWFTEFPDTRNHTTPTPADILVLNPLYKELFALIQNSTPDLPIRAVFWFSS